MTVQELQKSLTDFLGCAGMFPKTNQVYHRHLDGLIRHAELLGGPPLEPLNCSSYLNSLKPTARTRAWGVLHRFCDYLQDEALIPKHPLSRIPRPKSFLKPHTGFLKADLIRILDQLEQNTKTHKVIHDLGAFRLKVMVMLVITHGLRVGSLIKLDVGQYVPEDGLLWMETKSGRPRSVKLSEDCQRLMLVWTAWRKDVAAAGEPAMFVTWKSERVDHWTVAAQVRKLLKKCGLSGQAGLHQFRHTMAQLLLEDGKTLPEIANYLGHYNLSSTDYYLRHHFAKGETTASEIVSKLLNKEPGQVIALVKKFEARE